MFSGLRPHNAHLKAALRRAPLQVLFGRISGSVWLLAPTSSSLNTSHTVDSLYRGDYMFRYCVAS